MVCYLRSATKYVWLDTSVKSHKLLLPPPTSSNKSFHKLLTSSVRIVCPSMLKQVWKKLLTTCNSLDGTIRVVSNKTGTVMIYITFLQLVLSNQ